MQPTSDYNYFSSSAAYAGQSTLRDLQYLLDRSAKKLHYKDHRSDEYVRKVNRVLDQLNRAEVDALAQIPSHKFYASLRRIIRDLLDDWRASYVFTEDESSLLRNGVRFVDRLVNIVPDVTKLTAWLVHPEWIDVIVDCLHEVDQIMAKNRDKHNLKSLMRLTDAFGTYYERVPANASNNDGLQRLFEAFLDCLVSANYERAFRKLKANAETMTTEQKFFLVKCPSLFSSYQGKGSSGAPSKKIIDQLLGTMVPRYASILDKHIQSVSQWTSPMIHAVHHLLLTVVHAKGHYTPYASGQPLQWLIDHITHIISEPAFIQRVNRKATNGETLLIQSALRTLTAFVHEPDLLVYLKQLKITSIFRSLLLLSNETIVLHAYVMLSYTLEEDDIKASEKDSGRLLSKIFDSLRKKIKSLSTSDRSEETIERNILLLVEAVQALVQHDQIKSEILKQNALPLLVNTCQQFNDRSKRMVLESIGSVTFDEEAARVLRENEQFIKSIEDMQKSKDDGIRKAAEKILWNLVKEPEREKKTEEKKLKKPVTTDSKEEKPKEYLHDIMISYCHADKELVYRVHQFLSDKGFKIWFDRDNIYGPAMQAMADAVENAEFVILCMSDSYKRSVYCQAEAEYAFHCKRRLIPIIVRQGYRADGWLGLILGSRIYVDFAKMDFKNACDYILKEINLQRESQASSATKSSERAAASGESSQGSPKALPATVAQSPLPDAYMKRNTTNATYRTTTMSHWTRKDVLDFLYDKNLHYMMPICELLTGGGLERLSRMCQAKPNRFYTQLSEELAARFNGLHLPIGLFTEFLSEMDRLIEKNAHSSPRSSTSATTPRTSTTKDLEAVESTIVPHSSASPSARPTSPVMTTIQTSCNVQITEQTAYRTASFSGPSTNVLVRSTQDTISSHSQQTELTRLNFRTDTQN